MLQSRPLSRAQCKTHQLQPYSEGGGDGDGGGGGGGETLLPNVGPKPVLDISLNPSSPSTASTSPDVCRCISLLDPFPSHMAWTSFTLQHYCRVCNTQLNSCKQVKIHATGKKHQKRHNYLKYCLETCDAQSAASGPSAPPVVPNYSPPQQQQQQQQVSCGISSNHSADCALSSYPMNTVCYYQPSQPPPTAASYSSTSVPPPSHHTAPYTSYVGAAPAYQECYNVAPPHTVLQPISTHPIGMQQQPQQQQQQPQPFQNMMSPSLTSGFSGSGGDCKSAETGSILSTASYASSSAKHAPQQQQQQQQQQPHKPLQPLEPYHEHRLESEAPLNMNVYTMMNVGDGSTAARFAGCYSLPTMVMPVSDEGGVTVGGGAGASKKYLVGCPANRAAPVALDESRLVHHVDQQHQHPHLVPAAQELGVVVENGAGSPVASGGGSSCDSGIKVAASAASAAGEIRCEVCQVSVNSSNQLHAHLSGHRHRIRCLRKGINPATALVTPISSSSPSRSPSECSFPHLHLQQQQQQQQLAPPPAAIGLVNQTSLLGSPCSRQEVRTSLMGNPNVVPKNPKSALIQLNPTRVSGRPVSAASTSANSAGKSALGAPNKQRRSAKQNQNNAGNFPSEKANAKSEAGRKKSVDDSRQKVAAQKDSLKENAPPSTSTNTESSHSKNQKPKREESTAAATVKERASAIVKMPPCASSSPSTSTSVSASNSASASTSPSSPGPDMGSDKQMLQTSSMLSMFLQTLKPQAYFEPNGERESEEEAEDKSGKKENSIKDGEKKENGKTESKVTSEKKDEANVSKHQRETKAKNQKSGLER